ncbi:hypothetical protein [Cohnella hongkongensis]|uniref:Uncharacterized protein n=1 Tax=Cohnella hongkongensis TaxID=178337 RepID=A0ABV9FBD7_9BACL
MLPADHFRVEDQIRNEEIFTPDEVDEILRQLEEETGGQSRD